MASIEISDFGPEMEYVRVVEPVAVPIISFDEVKIIRSDDGFQILVLKETFNVESKTMELQVAGRLLCGVSIFPRLLLRECARWCGKAWKSAIGMMTH